MCGLIGVYGRVHEPQKNAFRTLSYLDILRGEDSFGVTMVENDMKTTIIKSLGTPYELLMDHPEEFNEKRLLKRVGLRCVMGHNRWATRGEVNVANAHPLEFDKVIGMHNGTLVDHSIKDFAGYSKDEVDSRVLYNEINDKGIAEAWKRAQGAMALTWWDKTTDSLHFIRNNERPLWYVMEGNHTLYWASEKWMLEVALKKANIHVGEYFNLPINKHITWTFKDKLIQTDEVLVPYVPPVVQYPQNQWNSNNYKNNTSMPLDVFKVEEYQRIPNAEGDWDGVFFGVTSSGKDIRLSYENPQNKEKWYKEIWDAVEVKKRPYFNYRKNSTYMIGKTISVHYSNVNHIPQYKVPTSKAHTVKDDQGIDVAFSEYAAITNKNCCVCNSLVPWAAIPDSIVFKEWSMLCCPRCKEDPTLQWALDSYVLDFNLPLLKNQKV